MERAGYKPSHEWPKIPMRGHTIVAHVPNKANVTPHKDFIG